jgi:protein-L-isoaspartate O-methyltransferase
LNELGGDDAISALGLVYSIEIIEELGEQAKKRLRREGCTNVELKIANGYHGWSEHAPRSSDRDGGS